MTDFRWNMTTGWVDAAPVRDQCVSFVDGVCVAWMA